MISPNSSAALEIEGRSPAIDQLDEDSVAALIFTADGRYLLQHRESRSGISYPNWWSLFGGAREHGERAEDAIRRELMEELEFTALKCVPFLGCSYEFWLEGQLTRKIFFSVPANERETQGLVQREGQGMAWLRLDEIIARGGHIVPYDLGVIALHHSWQAYDRR
jgi:8-oxo-dGTP pyrophosphatase MutT (NUDIX family)